MVASISCPKCHDSWIPAPKTPPTSRVCPSCRRAPSVASPTAPCGRRAARSTARPSNRAAVLPLIAAPVAVAAVVLVASAMIGLTWRSFHAKAAKQPNAQLVVAQHAASPDSVATAHPDSQPTPNDDPRPVEPLPAPIAADPELIAEPTPLADYARIMGQFVAWFAELNSKPTAIAEPAPPAVANVEPRPEEPPRPPFRRRKPAPATDDLLHQLAKVKEIDLDTVPGGRALQELIVEARKTKSSEPRPMPTALLRRSDLIGLPMRMGEDCHLGKESAEALQTLSRTLRTYLGEASQAAQQRGVAAARGGAVNSTPDVATLKGKIAGDLERKWLVPEAVPTLEQILQAEDKPLRIYLVQLLAQIKGPAAGQALANRALFDVSDEVREAAVAALGKRDPVEYRDVLLAGLRHPWPAAAEFAAEALINLKETAVLIALVNLLDEPTANEPFVTKVGDADVKVVREMVRVNHLRNCMLCHAPSADRSDLVRGLVPDPKQPLPPSFSTQYYENSRGQFVRADITYLKQDFSVPQPAAQRFAWPTYQRYDYLVRTRPLPATEKIFRDAKTGPSNPQRDSTLFALRELTGEDGGNTSDGWRLVLQRALNNAAKR